MGLLLASAREDSLSYSALMVSLAAVSLASFHITDCLSISSIRIPAAVPNGSQVTLCCNYDLAHDEQLYSVKWYKNYVEFYRFQPDQESSSASSGRKPTLLIRSGDSISQDSKHLEANSKTQFELEGINLDLSRSNETHVYLKQALLSTEATYKCEISADSPTFATISAERELKVYVLPKQKLAIVNHSPSTVSGNVVSQPFQTDQKFAHHHQNSLVYSSNDQVNLTCIAGPSKPAADITWFINDLPVSSSSRWISAQKFTVPAPWNNDQLTQDQLIESRLTLSFKLQPSYPFRNGTITTIFSRRPLRQTASVWLYQVKFRCIAKLAVDFNSETNILVSAGKTTIKRRYQKQLLLPAKSPFLSIPSSVDSPSSHQLSGEVTTSKRSSQDLAIKLAQVEAEISLDDPYPAYRWPRLSQHQFGPNMTNLEFNPTKVLSSSENVADSVEKPIIVPTWEQQYQGVIGGANMQSFGRKHVAVWTNNQLKAQMEHIDDILRKSHPNELEQPMIEAKTGFEINDNDFEPHKVNVGSQKSPPRTNVTLEGSYKNEQCSRRGPIFEQYGLNESVLFTCSAQIQLPEQEHLRRVNLKWMINDREINGTKINSFDGSEFRYQSRAASNELNSYNMEVDHSDRNKSPSYSTYITKTRPMKDDEHMFEDETFSMERRYLELRKRSLNIKLTPSLFQLKELVLKCRTIVEQPIIEYEGQIVLSIETRKLIKMNDSNDQHEVAKKVYSRPLELSNIMPEIKRIHASLANSKKFGPNDNNLLIGRKLDSSSTSSVFLPQDLTGFKLGSIRLATSINTLILLSTILHA